MVNRVVVYANCSTCKATAEIDLSLRKVISFKGLLVGLLVPRTWTLNKDKYKCATCSKPKPRLSLVPNKVN